MQTYHVEREIAVLPLSMYTLGFVFGPIIAAPLSELYGRRNMYWTSMTLLIIFIAISGSANSITLLIVMRLLAGMGGSSPLAIGGGKLPSHRMTTFFLTHITGTISDMWNLEQSGKAALGFILAPFLGPAL